MNKKYQRYINYIVNDIEPPYLKSLEPYGLKHNEKELVLSKLYDQQVTIKGNDVYDPNHNKIYGEDSNGFWVKKEYDQYGNEIYYENKNGLWYKKEFDTNGNVIYFEDNNGYWEKREYDVNSDQTYFENSRGYWLKQEFDQAHSLNYFHF